MGHGDPDEQGEETYQGPEWDIDPITMPQMYQDLLFATFEMGMRMHSNMHSLLEGRLDDLQPQPIIAKTMLKGIEAPVYVVFAPNYLGPALTWVPIFVLATNNLTNMLDIDFPDVISQRAYEGDEETMRQKIIDFIDSNSSQDNT